MLNGIFVINKPKGMTSGDVVYHLRRCLHMRRVGHAGTLDPEVDGVLPVAVGQATKLIELMHTKPKAYRGSGRLGLATDSYDLAGKVLQEQALAAPISAKKIQTGMQAFLGEISQQPPIYSAVKVNGKHLYDYARAGEQVEIPTRQVTVSRYDLTGEPKFDQSKGTEDFDFVIECSKGTYVRSLVNDLGVKLGVPAVMTQLTRTASSGFNLDQAVDLQVLENSSDPEQYLHPIDDFFSDLPQLELTLQQWQQVKNGAWLHLGINAKQAALSYNKKVKAIYRAQAHQPGLYRPELMFLQNN
ncbi:MAG: tRNA pseudouridine(55) synthase TruB [Lactobacillus sp.]|jgi:tRNA pseudouridine55 synthase|nr:tRNA pseudouridine(55) synthase TruB [Lactobacillus sp.]MCH3906171.1 tRNA pseudouridine(55) synthase TruB [Lactobacillus sp.]MCH3990252.1 tRNA pseudouridine(55) synthase TruB [Lactobacillus sp.]MCH4069034.1 tRNA pseudouridine(55) synthase TruB [Lactobacillus sp.]MCI1303436.1 tRNA pseudouridine(55) synthase TruB [Lactobacillus sp.]